MMPTWPSFTVTSIVRDAQHEGVVMSSMDRQTIPIRPELAESGIPLAGWTIRIVPKASDVTDSEYDAGLAAITEHDAEISIRKVLTCLSFDARLQKFSITME